MPEITAPGLQWWLMLFKALSLEPSSWRSKLSHCRRCQHPIKVSVRDLAALLLTQFLATALGTAAEDGPCAWAPITHAKTQMEVLVLGLSLVQCWLL